MVIRTNGPLRVLHLVNHPGNGGTERYIANLCSRMPRDRFQLFLGHSEAGPLVDELRAMGAETEQVAMRHPFDLKAVRRVAAIMKHWRIDVVHTHFLRENFIAIMGAKLAGVPVVVNTVHIIEPKSRVVGLLNQVMTRGCDRVIAVSEAVRRFLLVEGLAPQRVQTIYGGIDLARFANPDTVALRHELGLADDALLIGSVGRLAAEKGHEDLIRAVPTILRAAPSTRFALVGDGPLMEPLKRLAAELGVADAVHFLGYRSDIPAVLATFDITVIPSRSEALGLAIIEALAARRPVVATDVGGIPEIITDGETGRLIPASQPEALAAAVVDLVQQPERRAALAVAGSRFVRQRFDLDEMVRQICGLYEHIYKGKR